MNVLAVLNVGGRSLHPKSRQSMQAAAKRWGVAWEEIRQPLAKVHPYWQKPHIPQAMWARGYERVLWLDADMLVRSDCPSPFDWVPEDHLGVVSAHQYWFPTWIASRDKCIRHWSKVCGTKPCRDERHLNGGFCLSSRAHHDPFFTKLLAIGRQQKWTKKYLPEQACMSVLIHRDRVPTTWLPHAFNSLGAVQLIRPDLKAPFMESWIYHYTGGPSKAKRVAGTWWNYPGGVKPQLAPRTASIVARIPQGSVGVEVGVLRAHNAAGILKASDAYLHLVDRWGPANPSYVQSRDGNSGWTADDWKVIHQEALFNLRNHWGRFQLHQCDSVQASRLFDRELDWVYIDADHSYEGCKADLEAWAPKVKAGGWIGGHDYGVNPRVWGVKRAVDEFAAGRRVARAGGLNWFLRL